VLLLFPSKWRFWPSRNLLHICETVDWQRAIAASLGFRTAFLVRFWVFWASHACFAASRWSFRACIPASFWKLFLSYLLLANGGLKSSSSFLLFFTNAICKYSSFVIIDHVGDISAVWMTCLMMQLWDVGPLFKHRNGYYLRPPSGSYKLEGIEGICAAICPGYSDRGQQSSRKNECLKLIGPIR
jgi:hypothetical protein